MKITIIINHANGYLNKGDYATAKIILDTLSTVNIKKSDKLIKLFQHMNWAIYYLGVKNLEQAGTNLEMAGKILDENIHLKTKYSDLFLPITLSFKLANNDSEGIEVELLAVKKNTKNLLGKVTVHFLLGQLYFQEKRFDEVVDAFNFVTTHGGDTHFVKTAKIYLNQIPCAEYKINTN